MTAWTSLQAVLRERPLVLDTALAAGVFVLALVARDPDTVAATSPTSAGPVLLAAVTCVVLVWRRAAPRRVLAISVLGNVVVLLLVQSATGLAAAALLALYTVAVSTDRRTTMIAWGATVVPLTLASLGSGAPISVDNVHARVDDAHRGERVTVETRDLTAVTHGDEVSRCFVPGDSCQRRELRRYRHRRDLRHRDHRRSILLGTIGWGSRVHG